MKLETKNFNIEYDSIDLKNYAEESLKLAERQLKNYFKFFHIDSYKQINVKIFSNRESWKSYLIAITGKEPPMHWHNTFINGEIQICVDPNRREKFTILAHELFHIMFNEYVYEANGLKRIQWLDEVIVACHDGRSYGDKHRLKEEIRFIKESINDFDLRHMLDSGKTNQKINQVLYKSYDVIANYLKCVGKEQELIDALINHEGIDYYKENLLSEAIDYTENNLIVEQ